MENCSPRSVAWIQAFSAALTESHFWTSERQIPVYYWIRLSASVAVRGVRSDELRVTIWYAGLYRQAAFEEE